MTGEIDQNEEDKEIFIFLPSFLLFCHVYNHRTRRDRAELRGRKWSQRKPKIMVCGFPVIPYTIVVKSFLIFHSKPRKTYHVFSCIVECVEVKWEKGGFLCRFHIHTSLLFHIFTSATSSNAQESSRDYCRIITLSFPIENLTCSNLYIMYVMGYLLCFLSLKINNNTKDFFPFLLLKSGMDGYIYGCY